MNSLSFRVKQFAILFLYQNHNLKKSFVNLIFKPPLEKSCKKPRKAQRKRKKNKFKKLCIDIESRVKNQLYSIYYHNFNLFESFSLAAKRFCTKKSVFAV